MTDRYSRQELLEEIGEDGQERLMDSRAVVVGAGALGSLAAELLVRAGVNLRIIDRDFVEESNLQRQVLYREMDVGRAKAEAAEERLEEMNGEVRIEGVVDDITSDNIEGLVGKPDVLLDCTDNMATRFLLNDYCLREEVPWIYGGAVGTSGIVFPVGAGGEPCLRCLIPEEPGSLETCDTSGILNAASSLVASLQVKETVRMLVGGETRPEMTDIDAWESTFQVTQVPAREDCPSCNGRYEHLERSPSLTSLCGRDAYHLRLDETLDLEQIEERVSGSMEAEMKGDVLHLFPDGKRITLFGSGRAIVEAEDESEARSRLSKFVGL